MKGNCRNIYANARKKAGLSQEHAAELLNISVRSLADYEAGKTVPADDVVCGMIQHYKTLTLAYLHLKTSTEVGRRYLPDIYATDLAQSVLRLHKEVDDLKLINSDMYEIACDGKVDHNENDRWNIVKKEVREIAGAALSLVFTP